MPEVIATRSAPLTSGVIFSGVIRSLRLRQWAKNGVIFAALLFSRHVGDEGSVQRALCAFGIFCMLSSAVYLLNDVFDLKSDLLHPTKRFRPVAAGEVPPALAVAVGSGLGL